VFRARSAMTGSRFVCPVGTGTIGVLVVSEIRLLREGLAHALSTRDHIQVIGATASISAAADLPPGLAPDVVLLHPAPGEGAQAVQAAATCLPDARIVALGVPAADNMVVAYAEAGVAGLVSMEGTLSDVVATVESVVRDETVCSPRVARLLLQRVATLAADREPVPCAALTARELQILALVDVGLSNKEIARRLYIEVPTVKNHVHRILDKLGVRNRAEAAAWARRHEAARLVRSASSTGRSS
jgi:DNA-binding NarL/FixJ family response regulator